MKVTFEWPRRAHCQCTGEWIMYLLLVLVLLVAGSPPAHAQVSVREGLVRTELQAFYSELQAAMRNKDRSALERLYAPEFVWMHGLGNHDDREEQIASILDQEEDFTGTLPAVITPDATLILEGNVAVLRRQSQHARRRLFNTNIFVKRNGAWQLLHIQGTMMGPELPAMHVPVETLKTYVGRYRQNNGNFADFSVSGKQLFVRFTNRPRWRLTPIKSDLFLDPSGFSYRFKRDAQQRVIGYEICGHEGTEVTGAREDSVSKP